MGIDIVKQSGLISVEEFEQISRLTAELKQTVDTAQIFRTKTEMSTSILNDMDFPTPDSKYWQAVREQHVMLNELIMLSFDYRKEQVRIKILQRKIAQSYNELQSELWEIEIERKKYICADMKRIANDRIREILEWSAIKAEVLPDMKYGTENVDAHQLESYTMRWNNHAQLMGSGGDPASRKNILAQAAQGNKETAKQNAQSLNRSERRRLERAK